MCVFAEADDVVPFVKVLEMDPLGLSFMEALDDHGAFIGLEGFLINERLQGFILGELRWGFESVVKFELVLVP